MPSESNDVFAAAARLYRERVPFVLATVVRAERPTSARPGAKAIVHADGSVEGFVGGTCVRPAVRRESLRALDEGKPRLLRISPEPGEAAEEGVLEEHMACVSGGAVDIHIEPYLPSRKLLLAGNSPVVEALAGLGAALGMEVDTVDSDTEPDGACFVVAGHGEGEWEALKAGLAGERAAYVGLVASPRRAAAVRERLAGMGLSDAEIARLRSPAGLDIGAETPGEIALSILAQMVQKKSQTTEAQHGEEPEPAATAVDPICGMSVSRDSPHRFEQAGEMFWFCCAGCFETFVARNENPEIR